MSVDRNEEKTQPWSSGKSGGTETGEKHAKENEEDTLEENQGRVES